MIKKIILIMSILNMINIFGYGEIKDDKVYMRIIKTPMGSFGFTDYKYNDKNIPLYTDQRGIVYGQIAYDRSRYYLFHDNKYVGEEAEDFDTVLLLTDSWIDYGVRPKRLIKKKDRVFDGYMFKFDNEKLVHIAEVLCDYTEDPDEIDLAKVKKRKRGGSDPSVTEILLNEDYYPKIANISSLKYYIDIYATQSVPEIKYIYEYYENKYTYDGKKQIKKIIDWQEGAKKILGTILEYDNLGRIKKIYKNWEDGNINELYLIYKNNVLFTIQRSHIKIHKVDSKFIKLYYNKYNEYGYLELKGMVKIDIDVEKDFDNLDRIIKELDKIEIKTGSYGRYKYEKANPKYKENLKIQPTLLIPEDLTEYFLGIHGWFRYKYLNDIKE